LSVLLSLLPNNDLNEELMLKENILPNLFFVVELSKNSLVFLLTSSSPESLKLISIDETSL
jgi:hypothetical protein